MPADRNKLYMGAAVLLAAVACLAIVLHYAFTEPPVIPDLTELSHLHPAVPTASGTPPPQPGSGDPSAATRPQTPPTLSPAPKAPSADFSTKVDDSLKMALRFRLKPEEFAFDAIPYDAPLAEFPLVLVDQRSREWYLTRDMEMDSRLSPAEADILDRMQTDIHGGGGKPPSGPPKPPPGRPEVPPEESYSGL